jgi:hypothetical protein
MAAKPPPQSASKQQRARMPNKIQSHKRLLDEFSVVVVSASGVVCPPWVVCTPDVVPGAVVDVPPMTAAPMAPAITPPAIRPPTIFFFPLPPEAVVVLGPAE